MDSDSGYPGVTFNLNGFRTTGQSNYYQENFMLNTKYSINMSYRNVIVNDITYTITETYNNLPSFSIFLFARNYRGSAERFSKTRIYEFSIKRNDEHKRNMIPCYRKSDNRTGMYDLVENKFYDNANGATEFTLGSEV